MSIVQSRGWYYAECDVCGAAFTSNRGNKLFATDARCERQAREHGWQLHPGDRHRCKRCALPTCKGCKRVRLDFSLLPFNLSTYFGGDDAWSFDLGDWWCGNCYLRLATAAYGG